MTAGQRAITDSQKNEIMERLLLVWKANPKLRFMQLLGNVYHEDPYHVEDYDMIADMEAAYAHFAQSAGLTSDSAPGKLLLAQERKPKPRTKV